MIMPAVPLEATLHTFTAMGRAVGATFVTSLRSNLPLPFKRFNLLGL